MAPTPRSLLMVTVWARKGGAERLILDLLDRVKGDFRAALGFVRPVTEAERTLEWRGPTVGLREILFGEWDLIHTHLFLPGLLVRLRRTWDGGFRWIHTVHYEGYDSLRWGGLKRWLDRRFVFPATDVLVAVSSSSRVALDRYPQTRLIQNAISLEPAGQAELDEPAGETEAGGPAGHAGGDADGRTSEPEGPAGRAEAEERPGPVVGTVAHLREEKGLEDLLRAAAVLRRARPGVRVRIAGAGPLRDRLEALREQLGLEEVVELCGFVHDTDAFYRGLDAYVQPSRSERFGLAALESMRFGLPVVAARVGFLPEMLGYGRFGETVERGDGFAERLAGALDRVLADPESFRARARRGLRHWRSQLDPDRMADEYRSAYRDALRARICMVQPVVTHAAGGLARQLLLQSRELARRGHRVHLVQRSDPELATDPERAERWRHVQVLGAGRIGDGDGGPGGLGERIRGLRFLAGGVLRLWQLRHRVDVIHAHQLYSPTLVGAAGKVLFDLPLVTKVTSAGDLGERSELRRLPFRRLRRLAFRAVDRLLVLTDAMAREMPALGFGPDRIRLVPNAVEIPREAVVGGRSARAPGERPEPDGKRKPPDAEGPPPDPPDPFRILFTGRLSREKSLDTLLRAGALLADEGRSLEIELVGDPDPDRDASPGLRELAADMPDACTVHFRGFHADVDPFYREADAFVLPSATEGLSNALLEAMARGLPCVASDIPSNRFVVGDGDDAGLLFRQGSPGSLARRLERLLADRDRGGGLRKRLGRGARRRARERFAVESVVDELESIYSEVVTAASPPPRGARASAPR